jgi:hypothetical protein
MVSDLLLMLRSEFELLNRRERFHISLSKAKVEAATLALRDQLNRGINNVDFKPFGFRHPNGFEKLVIYEDANSGCRLRVHHWAAGTISDSDIHNHRWNCSSLTIQGTATMEVYLPRPDKYADPVYLPHPRTCKKLPINQGARYSVERNERDHWHAYDRRELSLCSGAIYALGYEIPHRIRVPPEQGLLTLFCSSTPVRNQSEIYGQSQKRATQRTANLMSAEEVFARVEALIKF